jgi:PRTRC genetic system protein A
MNKNLELENMLVGHFIGQMPNECDKPVSYVMQGNGLWEIRKNTLGVFRRHAAKAHVPGLPSTLKEGFDLHVPKIPLSLLWKAVAFFRKVFELHKSEAIVRVIFNHKMKRYFLDCPPQEVNAAHCGFNRTRMPNGGVVVAEIHSHGGLRASFSSTDDNDELADRFYGIVGKVYNFFPQTCFRVSIGGQHLSISLSDIFAIEKDPMLGAKFPPEWLNQVKEYKPKLTNIPDMSMRYPDDPEDMENMIASLEHDFKDDASRLGEIIYEGETTWCEEENK